MDILWTRSLCNSVPVHEQIINVCILQRTFSRGGSGLRGLTESSNNNTLAEENKIKLKRKDYIDQMLEMMKPLLMISA